MVQLGAEIDGDGALEIRALLGEVGFEGTDPHRLFHLARYNKMLHLIPMTAHPTLAPRLLEARIATVGMNGRAIRAGAEISKALAAAQVRHVVMKGPWQQVSVHDTGFLRPSGDVDLFVAPKDRVRAAEVVGTLDYRVFEHGQTIWWLRFLGEQHFHREADGAVVDLHHRLLQVGLPSWRHAEDVLARSVLQGEGDDRVPVPDPATGCLLLAITIAKALLGSEPCGWAVRDLSLWLARLSVEERRALDRVARRAGQTRSLRLALQLVEACYGGSAAQSVLPGPARTKEELRSIVYQPWHHPQLAPRRRHLLRALGKGRPVAVAQQGVMSVLSPVVLSVLKRREGKA
ncbi:nucleotidyltransferase family protein [Falsirhodobacter sp. 20TX0035]|uniref:nucleotidyltransferase family protein n=1 Tax=Falsirhodobacter sp. 20TX0035 TaxID=3022019 RepID=UPI00232C6A38|nr:nucleotidyltransferase family protein [Falsirhodobacter sp. 20TX0035]MDB6454807.1 nucleotidyltransferase family protein [Falsirhodobacter sp. 20TX0035]